MHNSIKKNNHPVIKEKQNIIDSKDSYIGLDIYYIIELVNEIVQCSYISIHLVKHVSEYLGLSRNP